MTISKFTTLVNSAPLVRVAIILLIATYGVNPQPCHSTELTRGFLTTFRNAPASGLARLSATNDRRMVRWHRRFSKWRRRKAVGIGRHYWLIGRPEIRKQHSTPGVSKIVQPSAPTADIVASVGTKYIRYTDVECSENNAEDEFVFRFGRVPLSTADLARVAEIKQEDELQNLETTINQDVSEEIFVRRHIFMTNYDLHRYSVPLPAGTSVYKMIDSMHTAGHQLEQVADGLQAVYQNGIGKDAAYKKYIAPSGDQFLWQVYVSKCLLPDQWNLLRKQAANDLSVTKQDFERSSIDSARHDKLFDYEDENLQATDKQYARDIVITHGYPLQTFVKLAEQSSSQAPAQTPITAQAEAYIRQARRKWWAAQYNSANIKIYMPSFQPALQDLLGR